MMGMMSEGATTDIANERMYIPENGDEGPVLKKIPQFPINKMPAKLQDVIRSTSDVFGVDMWVPFSAILRNVASLVGAQYTAEYGPYTVPAHQADLPT